MRKLTLFILGVFILGASMMGEENSSKPLKDELSFGLGAGLSFGLLISVSTWANFFTSYMHDFSKRVSLGATVFCTFFDKHDIFFGTKETGSIVGLYPKLRLYYYHGKKTRLYGDIGLGYGGQITFLGVNYTWKDMGCFLQFGAGFEGFLSFGISYRF